MLEMCLLTEISSDNKIKTLQMDVVKKLSDKQPAITARLP